MAATDQPIIIKRYKKVAHAHHGGAWKIAYADFVTAMMAFFLLLWLISMTTPEQKEGLANYFAPPSVSPSTSGAGGVMGGQALDSDGAKMAGAAPEANPKAGAPPAGGAANLQEAALTGIEASLADPSAASAVDIKSKYSEVFSTAAASIKQAWQAMPEITEIAENLLVEQTDEGLSIQIVDQVGRPMFPEGSKYPFELTRKAIAAIAPTLQQLSNQITISGHTAVGSRYSLPNYGAWDLSADRANVVREILGEFGLSDSRIYAVSGRATAEPFFINDPYMAANERIKILVLYDSPPVPPDLTP